MNSSPHFLHTFTFFVLLLLPPSLSLNSDGILLLSFKYSILSDPLSVLETWNYEDESPCEWNGITCTEIGTPGTSDMFRVTSLILPNSQLLGSIPTDLGLIQHLRHLDLSNNFFNGSLPTSIFNASELQVLSLSNNVLTGELHEEVGGLKNLQVLNLSENALAGKVPENLTDLQNLTVVSMRNNYFSGKIPSRFGSVLFLDLSSNLLNESLPLSFGGNNLQYLNISFNKISGPIPPDFAKKIPENATIDLSFNNLTGAIPASLALHSQKTETFAGNTDLCGKPLKLLCSVPSTLSTPPPNTSTTSSPAIAAIPKSIESNPVSNLPNTPNGMQNQQQHGLKPGTIAGITVGDLAGIGILAMIIFYVYQIRKRKSILSSNLSNNLKTPELQTIFKQEPESKKPITWSCLPIKGEETSEATSSDGDDHDNHQNRETQIQKNENYGSNNKGGSLVAVDEEIDLELETLLKASAYVLGASGGSILYKAVLENGTALAVRRMGESAIEKMKDFEAQVKNIAKLRHPNLVRVRGFYWGDDEKLVIFDFVSNGCLATYGYRKFGSSPCNLPLEVRLKIVRGVARGLAYIHEKKQVHGNIKPSNILLNSDMDPIISDFGLERLISGNNANKIGHSSRHFGLHRLTNFPNGVQDLLTTGIPFAASSGPSSSGTTSPYQAPESLKNLKPNPKWDVYSFGMILLELLTGKVFSDLELSHRLSGQGLLTEEKTRVLRMVDVSIRGEMECREDVMLACFKLGFSCASLVPQKRPSMKEASQILEKISC